MIACRSIRLRIGSRTILDDVSLVVPRGASVALAGANGSGKTSLLRCLLGLVPYEGTASIGGFDVARDGVAARTLAAYLPQRAGFGDTTAREALTFVARLRRIPPGRVDAALAEVDLAEHARQRVRTFSGGMQQRLSLATVLLTDAPVLLFDEPTVSLDAPGQELFDALVGRLRREGRTLLLSSHRAGEIERLTDEVIHLDRGRIVGAASPRPLAPVVCLKEVAR